MEGLFAINYIEFVCFVNVCVFEQLVCMNNIVTSVINQVTELRTSFIGGCCLVIYKY